jgi:hypothetical protein
MAKVHADHNGGLSESTFFHHLKIRDDLERQAMGIKAKQKAAEKSASDDGIDIAALKQVLKDRAIPVAERIKRFNQANLYRRFLGQPEGKMLPVLDENFNEDIGLTDEQREEKWRQHGYIGAREGKGLTDVMGDHDPNLAAGRCIREGWEKGQAENAKGIKATAKKPDPVEPAAPADEGKVVPKDEPEVAEAKKRGRPPKAKGLTYWHKPDARKVYEVSQADAPPEGAVNITKEEYEALKAQYEKADEDDWDSVAPAGADAPPAPDADAPPIPD